MTEPARETGSNSATGVRTPSATALTVSFFSPPPEHPAMQSAAAAAAVQMAIHFLFMFFRLHITL